MWIWLNRASVSEGAGYNFKIKNKKRSDISSFKASGSAKICYFQLIILNLTWYFAFNLSILNLISKVPVRLFCIWFLVFLPCLPWWEVNISPSLIWTSPSLKPISTHRRSKQCILSKSIPQTHVWSLIFAHLFPPSLPMKLRMTVRANKHLHVRHCSDRCKKKKKKDWQNQNLPADRRSSALSPDKERWEIN